MHEKNVDLQNAVYFIADWYKDRIDTFMEDMARIRSFGDWDHRHEETEWMRRPDGHA